MRAPSSPLPRPLRGARRCRSLSTRAIALALLPLLPLVAGLVLGACDGAEPSPSAPAGTVAAAPPPPVEATPAQREAARERLRALLAAHAPIEATTTNDLHDQWITDQRRVRRELLADVDPVLAEEALAAFDASRGEPATLRAALLELAATGLPERVRPRLEELILTYDAEEGYGLRGLAVGVYAATSPAAAVELLEPLVLETRHKVTLPPQEDLVRGWLQAADAIELDPDRVQAVLAEVTTGIFQPDSARHVAIEELGRRPGERGRLALEEVLVESSSNGYLRRKAAQALRDSLSPEDLCPILERVADKESDTNFLLFLADMLERSCGF